ncbi:DNA-directed RNA polymerase [Mycena galericulata]|nr:DNA-directed RNA polymerase [Mycena galericulata]
MIKIHLNLSIPRASMTRWRETILCMAYMILPSILIRACLCTVSHLRRLTMNAPNRHELFVLDDGEKLLEVTEDTKIPNAATFKIVKQDHTLGNMLRAQLLAMPEILFAGYKVPHPLHPYFLLKIQTDGSTTPQAVLDLACTRLIGTMSALEAKFKREFSFKDGEAHGAGAGVGMGIGANEDPYGSGGAAWSGQRDYLDF